MSTFRTSDIILAACLRLANHSMTSIEICGTKGTFVFSSLDEDFISEFDLGNIQVEPVAFNNMIKQLTTSVRRMTQKA